MPETLLRTKLSIPPLRPNMVPRQRLITRLNEGLQLGHRLTLVSAATGSGKTTLISSWIHRLETTAAWLSLDEADNEPTRFVYYLLTALQEAGCVFGANLIKLSRSPQPPPIHTLLTLLINDLAKADHQVILVLDDYHVIRELEIHRAMTFLLDRQPPRVHLVVISRSDPPFPLHRLRGSAQMGGIYARDLRFTVDEVASFFAKTLGLHLSPDDLVSLERRTQGLFPLGVLLVPQFGFC